MTIAIIGAGAIGGSLAGYLIQSKQDVTLIDFWPENVTSKDLGSGNWIKTF